MHPKQYYKPIVMTGLLFVGQLIAHDTELNVFTVYHVHKFRLDGVVGYSFQHSSYSTKDFHPGTVYASLRTLVEFFFDYMIMLDGPDLSRHRGFLDQQILTLLKKIK